MMVIVNVLVKNVLVVSSATVEMTISVTALVQRTTARLSLVVPRLLLSTPALLPVNQFPTVLLAVGSHFASPGSISPFVSVWYRIPTVYAMRLRPVALALPTCVLEIFESIALIATR